MQILGLAFWTLSSQIYQYTLQRPASHFLLNPHILANSMLSEASHIYNPKRVYVLLVAQLGHV